MPENSLPQTPPPAVAMAFDGAPLSARPGQTVGAALTDAGILSWRSTRNEGRPRGLFCGIGICFDCLLTVNGTANQRACLTTARDGMELCSGPTTQSGDGAP